MTIIPSFSSFSFTQQIAQKTHKSFFSSGRTLFILSLAAFALLSLTYAIYRKSLKTRKLTRAPQLEPSVAQALFTQTISPKPALTLISYQDSKELHATLPNEQANDPLPPFPPAFQPPSDSNSLIISNPEQTFPESRVAIKLTLPEGICFEGSADHTTQPYASFQGSLVYPDGTTIKGHFEKGELNGEGFAFYGDRQTEVTGHFANGNLVEGVASYPDGEMIEGTFCSDKLNGFGKITYKDGMIKKGQFVDDKLEGEGEIFAPQNESSIQFPHCIKGYFEADELTKGEMIYADHTLTGTFKSHLLDGPGCTVTYSDQDIFMEGEFKAGMLEGLGKIAYKNGPQLEGFFKQGELSGPATITYPDQRTTQGLFINGKLNGIGRIEQTDGSIHEGMFKDNQLQGLGRITMPDGTIFQGWFEKDLLNGKGQIYYSNGQLREGLFTRGTLTKPESIDLPTIPSLDLSKLAEEYLSSDLADKSPFIFSLSFESIP